MRSRRFHGTWEEWNENDSRQRDARGRFVRNDVHFGESQFFPFWHDMIPHFSADLMGWTADDGVYIVDIPTPNQPSFVDQNQAAQYLIEHHHEGITVVEYSVVVNPSTMMLKFVSWHDLETWYCCPPVPPRRWYEYPMPDQCVACPVMQTWNVLPQTPMMYYCRDLQRKIITQTAGVVKKHEPCSRKQEWLWTLAKDSTDITESMILKHVLGDTGYEMIL